MLGCPGENGLHDDKAGIAGMARWTCPECGTLHDRDFNAACNIKKFGLKALPTERGKVKPVDCPLVDNRPRVLKSNGRKKQEKRGGKCISEAAKSLA